MSRSNRPPIVSASASAARPRRRMASALAAGSVLAAMGILISSFLIGAIATASTPTTLGYRDFGYGGALASRPTSEPEQSKLWYNDGAWWGGLFVSSGSGSGGSHFDIFKFDPVAHSWVDTTRQVDIRDLSHADYLWDGAHNKLYVASSKSICTAVPAPPTQPCNDAIRVYRYSYNSAAPTLAGKYILDSGFPKTLVGGLYGPTGAPFTGGGSNAVTIAKDSTGEIWVAYTRNDPTTAAPPVTGFNANVYTAHTVSDADPSTVADETTWTAPARFAGAVDGQLGQDNTASIVAFGGSKIGLYWTDKHATGSSSALFAVHADGDPEATWSSNESIVSATNAAQDQVNLKTDSTGKVYAIIKTGLTDQIRLYDRSTGGTWTGHNVWTSGNGNVRAQVAIDEELGIAYALSASGGTTAGTVYVKAAPLSTLAFPTGKGSALLASASDPSIDDVTVSKQGVTAATGILAEASDRTTFEFLHAEMPLTATDVTAPSGTVTINSGAAFTGSTAVSLAVPATDAGSGVALVRISNAGNGVDGSGALSGAGSTSLGWAPTVTWTLSAGDGLKTIWVQWSDGAGNWSTPISATISLDQTGPTGTVSINGGATLANSLSVSLDVPATDAGVGVVSNVRIANVGTTSGGILTDASAVTSAYAPTKSWTLAAGADGGRTVYVQWQDSLGNWSGVSNDAITLDTTPPAAGTVIIDGGAASTSAVSRQVTLTLSNPDGVTNIRVAESLAGLAVATPQAYAASTPFTLSAGLDGTRTVYVQWLDDAGNPSTAASDSIRLDLRHPVGTVAIDSGAAGVHQLAVILTFPNSDTDIDTISISNSPTMAGAVVRGTLGVPFAGGTPWTLLGPLTNGSLKAVYVTFHDLGGNTSDIVAGAYSASDTVKVDLTAPILRGAVTTSWIAGTTMLGNYVSLQAIWPLATDTGTGVAAYRVFVSVDGHPYTVLTTTTARTARTFAATGHTYRFRVFAFDRARNISASVYSPIVRVLGYQDSNRAIRYSSGWHSSISTAYYGGTARYTVARLATASLTFSGRSVAWNAILGPTRGSARVYIDGRLISTVNLNSPTVTLRRIVFARTWSAVGTHTIRVVVLGTAGHPRVDLDAFIVLR